MKKSILIFALLTLSIVGFSQRVMTSAEKQALVEDPEFQYETKWAIRDYAAYWAMHDGSGLSTEAARIKWAKDRFLSVPIVVSDTYDQNAAIQFAKLAKGMQLTLPTAPAATSVIIDALKDGNKFEELASLYFDIIGETVNFSVSDN